MSAVSRAWIAAARLRRRLDWFRPAGLRWRSSSGRRHTREELVRAYAPGCSWLDVGCMWGIDGGLAFLAEASGATDVCGIDVIAATPAYLAERERRGSAMRFVHGDLHDPAVLAAAGPHDVVWCSGVLYHAPSPLLTLERLRSVTRGRLILSTEALPELPGVPGACVFYPALGDAERAAYAAAPGGRAIGVTEPFDPAAAYGNWFWGITPSALRGMLRATGFEIEREIGSPFHRAVVATIAR